MLSIDMGTSEKASQFMELMEMHDVGYLAVSLGYFKTLFSNSGKSTSSEVPEEVQHDMGLSAGLVRFSVVEVLNTHKQNTTEKKYKTL